MNKLIKAIVSAAVLSLLSMQASAGVIFSFIETGGNVEMQTSGSLNTENLVETSSFGVWSGIGIETNAAPQSDIMGDTINSPTDIGFGFSDGTDLSPWIGDLFTLSRFGLIRTGTTSFTTYVRPNGVRTPGISMVESDIVNGFWTPDVSWLSVGSTFADFGLIEGDYTITDIQTGEFISIIVGDPNVEVNSPATLALMGLALFGLGFVRKRAQ
ncbi:PEP-CTERM sorting domain-containing protein [Glaciecola siphonariae]|uniref:PEP-CTERM sorting domain-containing protein n=1 Tax=Glaciecola siphonariae TaxID=521012 RepID=A0ABV9LWU7_9ALTE